MKTVKIVIAAHKKYQMPSEECYLPLQVGAEGKPSLGYVRDNTGDNISLKNPSFCELTGLYWAWKNVDADYLGLVHYRRHFSLKKKSKDPFKNVLNNTEAHQLIKKYRVIVPNKRHYYIETLYSHYKHTHYESQLIETRKIIDEKYPDYSADFSSVVKQTWGYMFNMMIMDKKLIDSYCSWLFDILFELEKRVEAGKVPDSINLDPFQARFYGRISEIIFNVWLAHQVRTGVLSAKDIKEVKLISMEKTNWWTKGTSFLKAKFFGKKYRRSF